MASALRPSRVPDHHGNTQGVDTLDSTAVATSRALVMILENRQRPDGTVSVPQVLRPFMGGVETIGKRRHP